MARDSLPHFPAPEKSHRPSQHQSSQVYMYQPPYQQSGGIPGGYPPPAGGYQMGPSNVYGSPPQSYPQNYVYPGQRPTSAQPPPGVDPQIYSRFNAADVNNTGQLTEKELRTALLNSDWTQFDGKTIKLMIKMFDVDRYLCRLKGVMLTGRLVPEQSGFKSSFHYVDILINGERYSNNLIRTNRVRLIGSNSQMRFRHLDIGFPISLSIFSIRHMTKNVSRLITS